MRSCQPEGIRRGAAAVEAAIMLPVFLILVLGMIDLAVGVSRKQMVCQAAREAGRLAMVRGSMAPSQLGQWGPTTFGPAPAESTDPIAKAVAAKLGGLRPSAVTLKLEWLDGSNTPESRVRATVTTTYQPVVTYIFGPTPITLTATSTVLITH